MGGAVTIAGTSNTLSSSAAASNEGTLSFTGTGGLFQTTSGGLTNSGTVTTAASAANSISAAGMFTNTGGSIMLSGSGDQLTAASFDIQGGTLTIGGTQNQVSASGASSNESTISFTGNNGTLKTTGGGFTNGGSLMTGTGGLNVVNIGGGFANSGTFALQGAGDSASIAGMLSNSGTLTVNHTGGTFTAASLDNLAAGMMTVDGTALGATGAATNEGTLTIGNGGTLSAASFAQSGGSTAVNTGGRLTATTITLTGGTLTGGGTLQGNVVNTSGTIMPGDPQSLGIMGNFSQASAGILDLDFASPSSYDHVSVTGNAALGGNLHLNLEAGFDAMIGTVFNIFSWGGIESGNFVFNGSANDPTFDNGTRTFDEEINGSHIDLIVMSTGVAPVAPEPSTGALLAVFMLGAAVTWQVRRRRNILNKSR
jgi:hypothetical protein